MSDPFWERLRDNKTKSRIPIYLSRGGKGSGVRWTEKDIADAQAKIDKYNKDVVYVKFPRDAEIIVIPDGASMLADKKTHPITQHLSEFYKMLKHNKVHSAKKSSEKGSHKKSSEKGSHKKSNGPLQTPSSGEASSSAVNTLTPRRKVTSAQIQPLPTVLAPPPVRLSFMQAPPDEVKVEHQTASSSAIHTLTPRRKVTTLAPPPVRLSFMQAPPGEAKVEHPTASSSLSAIHTLNPRRKVTSALPTALAPPTVRAPHNETKREQGNSANGFPCAKILQLFMMQFPDGTVPSLEEIERRVRSTFVLSDDALTAQIARVVKRKLIKQTTAPKPKKYRNKKDDELDLLVEEHKRRLKAHKETEDLIDDIFNKEMEAFNAFDNPTDEEYDELLNFLEDEIERVLENVDSAPSYEYLVKLAHELWDMREGYDSFDVNRGASDLAHRWKNAAAYGHLEEKFKDTDMSNDQDQLYQQLHEEIDEAPLKFTIDELFAALTEIIKIAQRVKGKDVIRAVESTNRDLVDEIIEKYAWPRNSVEFEVKKMWT